MNINDIPYNQLLGIQNSDNDLYLLKLDEDTKYHNHIQSIHAAALFSLAEATAAKFLLMNFYEFEGKAIPLLRKSEIKFKKPTPGPVYSKATLLEESIENISTTLREKSKALLKIQVQLFNNQEETIMVGDFEWFVSLI